MNGSYNSSAAGLVAVRVPEDETTLVRDQWCDHHHHCDRDVLVFYTTLGVYNNPSTWKAGVTLIRV